MSFSGGTFSINSAGQPVVSGTSISITAFNALTADLATGLSTCMLKDGTQTATAGIGFYAGTVSLPGIYLGTDTATGLYRIGLNNYGFSVNGTKLLDLGTTVFAVTGSVTATTTISATTGMAVGGATAGAGGVAFPATQVAVADVNTLDDYEEGTFTAGVSFGGGTTGITYAARAAFYTKIGNRVFFNLVIVLSNKGSSTGSALITGLPFTSGSDTLNQSAVAISNCDSFAAGTTTMLNGYVGVNATTISLFRYGAGTLTALADTDFTNSSQLAIAGSYKV